MDGRNSIEERQNGRAVRMWLLAQRRLYSRAKGLTAWQLLLSAVGVGLALTAWQRPDWFGAQGLIPEWAGWVFGLAATLANKLLFPPWQKRWRNQAAHVQELIDTEVLQLPWPDKAAVPDDAIPRPLVQEIAVRQAAMPIDPAAMADWYDPSAGSVARGRQEGEISEEDSRHTLADLPLAQARLVCQAQNLGWDNSQRGRLVLVLAALFWGLSLVALAAGLWADLPLREWVPRLFLPLLPALLLLHDLRAEQTKVIERLGRLQEQWAKGWATALQDPAAPGLDAAARELQDALFKHRRSAPPVFDSFYNLLRAGEQRRSLLLACQRVDEALARAAAAAAPAAQAEPAASPAPAAPSATGP